MRRLFKLLLLVISLTAATKSGAQGVSPGERVPSGAIVYSLPITILHFVVDAECESFIAGPYARYAQKYLGTAAREEDGTFYKLKSVEIIPYIEADPAVNIALNIGSSKNASANFLEMTNQGLLIWSDSYGGKSEKMRFPNMNDASVFDRSASSSNLTSEQTTLYRTVGTERIAVNQSQVVEKSPERRAEEAANMIFNLRAKKMDIITGETDATFSGEALKAAVEEMNKLEEEYLSLFLGKSDVTAQRLSFDVVPTENERQMYIAFRISETQGLLPSDNLSGRPIVLELIADEKQTAVNMETTSAKGRVLYRKPLMMRTRLSDGQTVIMQARVPIYQLGTLMSFPIDIATGK